uniref:RRM domain-containing protein n=1 Tax=Globisporangium ultimum (strain ATCC 200006 / CBS 805.95 / DAOM BR144) TaxID=431595 RepID=K3X185_GLOUD
MANMTAQDEAKDDACIYLRVKNLPGVLSEDAVSSLLRHYGALHVKLLQDRAAKPARATTLKPPQTAIATFSTSDARAKALARLRNMQLAGHQLRADLLGNDGAEDRESKTGHAPENDTQAAKAPVATQPPLPRDPPPPLPPPTQPHTNKHVGHSYYAPASLAPHLGLHFAPSPLLEYKYPKANEQIVRNIAN